MRGGLVEKKEWEKDLTNDKKNQVKLDKRKQ